jgi:hypothetical protein
LITVELMVVCVLALLAFGIQKRSLSFFGIPAFGWRDLGAMLVAMFWTVALVFITTSLVQRFGVSTSSPATDTDDIALRPRP